MFANTVVPVGLVRLFSRENNIPADRARELIERCAPAPGPKPVFSVAKSRCIFELFGGRLGRVDLDAVRHSRPLPEPIVTRPGDWELRVSDDNIKSLPFALACAVPELVSSGGAEDYGIYFDDAGVLAVRRSIRAIRSAVQVPAAVGGMWADVDHGPELTNAYFWAVGRLGEVAPTQTGSAADAVRELNGNEIVRRKTALMGPLVMVSSMAVGVDRGDGTVLAQIGILLDSIVAGASNIPGTVNIQRVQRYQQEISLRYYLNGLSSTADVLPSDGSTLRFSYVAGFAASGLPVGPAGGSGEMWVVPETTPEETYHAERHLVSTENDILVDSPQFNEVALSRAMMRLLDHRLTYYRCMYRRGAVDAVQECARVRRLMRYVSRGGDLAVAMGDMVNGDINYRGGVMGGGYLEWGKTEHGVATYFPLALSPEAIVPFAKAGLGTTGDLVLMGGVPPSEVGVGVEECRKVRQAVSYMRQIAREVALFLKEQVGVPGDDFEKRLINYVCTIDEERLRADPWEGMIKLEKVRSGPIDRIDLSERLEMVRGFVLTGMERASDAVGALKTVLEAALDTRNTAQVVFRKYEECAVIGLVDGVHIRTGWDYFGELPSKTSNRLAYAAVSAAPGTTPPTAPWSGAPPTAPWSGAAGAVRIPPTVPTPGGNTFRDNIGAYMLAEVAGSVSRASDASWGCNTLYSDARLAGIDYYLRSRKIGLMYQRVGDDWCRVLGEAKSVVPGVALWRDGLVWVVQKQDARAGETDFEGFLASSLLRGHDERFNAREGPATEAGRQYWGMVFGAALTLERRAEQYFGRAAPPGERDHPGHRYARRAI